MAGAALASASQCDSELDDSEEATALAALVQSLRRLADWASLEPAWRQFRHARGGGDACALAYLRTGGNDPEAAAVRIADTLSFRQANGLVADDAELWRAVEEHPARDRWPFAYLPGSEVPDGSPVCYARLSQLQVAATLAAFDEEELMHFVALWFEGAQRLLGDSSRRRGDPVRGTYDVYDCADLSAWSFLSEVTLPRHFSRHLVDPRGLTPRWPLWSLPRETAAHQTECRALSRCPTPSHSTHATRPLPEVRAHRPAIKRIFAIGSEHFPDLLYKCYVLNAPTVAALVWRCAARGRGRRLGRRCVRTLSRRERPLPPLPLAGASRPS